MKFGTFQLFLFFSRLKLLSFLFLYRDACNEKINISKMSESTPLESSVSDSSSLAATPGNVVWARTDGQVWWPAEVFTITSCSICCFLSLSMYWFVSQYGI